MKQHQRIEDVRLQLAPAGQRQQHRKEHHDQNHPEQRQPDASHAHRDAGRKQHRKKEQRHDDRHPEQAATAALFFGGLYAGHFRLAVPHHVHGQI